MNYGCCKCQCRHYSGDPLYKAHQVHMSKHGFMHSDLYEPYRPEHLKSRNATGVGIVFDASTLSPINE